VEACTVQPTANGLVATGTQIGSDPVADGFVVRYPELAVRVDDEPSAGREEVSPRRSDA
jgi:hypothetical protein